MSEGFTDARDLYQTGVEAENQRLAELTGIEPEAFETGTAFTSDVMRHTLEQAGARLQPNLLGREIFGYQIAKRVQRWTSYRLAAIIDMEQEDMSPIEFRRRMLAHDSFGDNLGADSPEKPEPDPYFFLLYSRAEIERLRQRSEGNLYPDPEEIEDIAALGLVPAALDVALDNPPTKTRTDDKGTTIKTRSVSELEETAGIGLTAEREAKDEDDLQEYTIIDTEFDLDDTVDTGPAPYMTGRNTYHITRKRKHGYVYGEVLGYVDAKANEDPEKLMTAWSLMTLIKRICPEIDQLIAKEREAV